MRKQYCLEWKNKTGRDGFKTIGYDCKELAEKELRKKIKSRSCASAKITWNYVGNDVPDEEIGNEYFLMGIVKKSTEILGMTMWFEDKYYECFAEGEYDGMDL